MNQQTYIAGSLIPGAGRGFFISSNVCAGDLIFAVNKPLLAILDENTLTTTCDECLAYFGTMGRNVDLKGGIKYMKCEGCGVLSYCGKACKDNAWNSHHKYECNIYKDIKDQESDADFKCTRIGSKRLRCIIRLLSLHKHKQISEADFKTFVKLAEGYQRRDSNWVHYTMNLFLKHGVTDLPLLELEHLILAVANNECQLDTPNLLTSYQLKHYGTYQQVEPLPLGMCLEPHYSMINHSCTPNAFWTFEGRELQVRAEKDISAGEEILISYIPPGQFYERMEKLGNWGIKCLCERCQKGPIEPVGSLRGRLDKLLNDKPWFENTKKVKIDTVKELINDMRSEGYGWGAWPMKSLFMTLYRCLRSRGDEVEMLKVLLRIRFSVEAEQEPKAFLSEKLETLRLLVAIMEQIGGHTESAGGVRELVGNVSMGLRVELLREIETCYGSTSALARWERRRFLEEIGDGKELEKGEFQAGLARLLAWANISGE
ncbi:hypothetical protein EG329_012355 [Mollisiaceae sp. DMI_Dod_QoI]|nr:hypothetical protein EG329_012355 [Helotiales sp. DMI_Dod_QoI]